MTFVVGLRGGIGTGKSTVSDLFASKGIVIADADVAARTVVEPDKPAYHEIVSKFGNGVLQADGSLDRATIRQRVFSNEADRKFLEQVTHRPIIQDLADTLASAKSEYAILVLSTGLGKNPMMQRLLVVDASEETQIARVMLRDDNDRAQVESILAAQPGRADRIADADDLIVNDGEPAQLVVEVEKLHRLYLSLARNN